MAFFVFALVLTAAFWHISSLARSFVAIREGFSSLALAGLTFAVAMAYRNKKVPRALAWLRLVSYSVYLLHPALIEVYGSVPWTQGVNFVPTELLMVALFLLALFVRCALTHRFVEVPMQRQGRRLAQWLDGRSGRTEVHEIPDQVPTRSS